MGADLIGSFAEATCATILIASAISTPAEGEMLAGANPIVGDFNALMFPLILTTSGIFVSVVTLFVCGWCFKINEIPDSSIERGLKGILIVSTFLQTPTRSGSHSCACRRHSTWRKHTSSRQ
jgi:inorganic pyrophosphatase